MLSPKAPRVRVVKAHDRHFGLEIDYQRKSHELMVASLCKGCQPRSQAAEITDSDTQKIKLKQWHKSLLITPQIIYPLSLKMLAPAVTLLSRTAAHWLLMQKQ